MTETKFESKKITELRDFNNFDKTETVDRQMFNRMRQVKLIKHDIDGDGWGNTKDYGTLSLLYKARCLKGPDTGDDPCSRASTRSAIR